MRGSRTKDELKVKVIEAKINDPGITLQGIEAKTGVNYETARNILNKDLPEVVKSSENVSKLLDRNNNLQSSADAMISEMIANRDKSITLAQLTSLRDSAFKQNQLIQMAGEGKGDIEITIQI